MAAQPAISAIHLQARRSVMIHLPKKPIKAFQNDAPRRQQATR
jgi:hypothetical protein